MGREQEEPTVGEILDGVSLWDEHRPQSGEDWVAVARDALRKIERVYERWMPGPRDALRDQVLSITASALSPESNPEGQ